MAPPQVRESHHAVRKVQTVAGNPRFDADRSELGHADEFWAHALALHAAEDGAQPAAGATIAAVADPFTPERRRGQNANTGRQAIFPRRVGHG